MMKNINLFKAAILASVAMLTACSTAAIIYETSIAGEVLPNLTKITDSADAQCPFGGDDGGPLFFGYAKAQDGHYDIYKKDNPLSGLMSQMTDLGTTGFADEPAYNKATDKIAFCMGYDIYTMPATKGKALTQITSPNGARDAYPCFNPDGSLIAYDRRIRTATTTYGLFSNYTSYSYPNSSSELWIKNLNNGENTMLGKGRYPSFSHDGKKIVYSKYEALKSEIWIMDIDGDNQTKITDNSTIDYAAWPHFSPDDKYIVFSGQDKDENWDIYIISVNGGDLTRLTICKSSDVGPYWSTDGYIYFASDRGGKKGDYNIWRFKYQN